MNMLEPILVIGGTRGTGLLIPRLLHRHGQRVRVLARDRGQALPLFDPTVQVLEGDVTKLQTLGPSIEGAKHIIFTAGCRSGYPVRESQVKAVEYEGVLNTLTAARQLGFAGRFLYMNSSGLTAPSFFATCLNLWKGNTLVWRRRVEEQIRASGLDYTIIRTGVLLNRPGGHHLINVTMPSYRERSARIAETLQRLNGPALAADVIESAFKTRKRITNAYPRTNVLRQSSCISGAGC